MANVDVWALLVDITEADSLSYGIVAGLSAIAFVLMYVMLPLKRLAFAYLPGLFFGGLTGIYALSYWGVVFTGDKAANTVVTATMGITAALVVLVLFTRMLQAMSALPASPIAPNHAAGGRRPS